LAAEFQLPRGIRLGLESRLTQIGLRYERCASAFIVQETLVIDFLLAFAGILFAPAIVASATFREDERTERHAWRRVRG